MSSSNKRVSPRPRGFPPVGGYSDQQRRRRHVHLDYDSNSNDSDVTPHEINMNEEHNDEENDNEEESVVFGDYDDDDDEDIEENETKNNAENYCVFPARPSTFDSVPPVIECRKLKLPSISKKGTEKERKRYVGLMTKRAIDLRDHIVKTRTLWVDFKSSAHNKYIAMYDSGKRLQSHHLKFLKTNGTATRKLEEQISKLKLDVKTKTDEIKKLKDDHSVSMFRVQSDHQAIVSTLRSDVNKLTNELHKSNNGKGYGLSKKTTENLR